MGRSTRTGHSFADRRRSNFARSLVSANSFAPTIIEIGSLPRLLDILTHEPATESELESAIAEIEDMLTPAIRSLPKPGNLVISSPELREVVKVVGRRTDENVRLDISTVEDVFSRLAAVAYGTTATLLGISEHRRFAATVLVLRELMHHAGFASVEARP